MPDTPPTDGTEVMRAFLPTSAFVGHVGIELTSLGDGEAELSLAYRDELATIGEVVHGGAIAALIDTAAMAAAWAGAEVPERLRGATVSLSVSYLAPAEGRDLAARARVVRRGRRIAHVHVEVRADRDPVAVALVAYQLG